MVVWEPSITSSKCSPAVRESGASSLPDVRAKHSWLDTRGWGGNTCDLQREEHRHLLGALCLSIV